MSDCVLPLLYLLLYGIDACLVGISSTIGRLALTMPAILRGFPPLLAHFFGGCCGGA